MDAQWRIRHPQRRVPQVQAYKHPLQLSVFPEHLYAALGTAPPLLLYIDLRILPLF